LQKWIYISLFISLIIFKPVAQLSWEIWYAVNIEYVAEELCENKEKPELECNGKCYLSKQLAKTEIEPEPDNKEKPNNPYQIREIPFVLLCSFVEPVTEDTFELEKHLFFDLKAAIKTFHSDIFHPPRILS